jgi:hypothetical protein
MDEKDCSIESQLLFVKNSSTDVDTTLLHCGLKRYFDEVKKLVGEDSPDAEEGKVTTTKVRQNEHC